MNYKVVFCKGQDGYYVAQCPAIPGCVSQGRTLAEAKRNIREAIELCLECCKEDCRKLPRDTTKVAEISHQDMSVEIPLVSGARVIKALHRVGYAIRKQKGSHVHLRHPDRPPVTVPCHAELDRATLKAILRDAGIPVEEFLAVLR